MCAKYEYDKIELLKIYEAKFKQCTLVDKLLSNE